MITNLKTPGVYVNEVNAFPYSVVPVETAVPAFIGYTPQAEYEGKSYLFKPMAIGSMVEFMAIYGWPVHPKTQKAPQQYSPSYYLTKHKAVPKKGESYTLNGDIYTIEPDPNTIYYLYNSLQLFFQNGGNTAYIVSVGSYGPPSGSPITSGDQIVNPNVLITDLKKGLATLKKVPQVTMYIYPEATLLSPADNSTLMELSLAQCGTMQTAIAIFDVIGGREPDPILWPQDIQRFRDATGNNNLEYGASYYPYLKTAVVPLNHVTYANINGGDISVLGPILNPPSAPNAKAEAILNSISSVSPLTVAQNSAALGVASKMYKHILTIIQEKINTLPPSGVMAGVYASVDANEGVWKAPANLSPIGITDVTLRIGNKEQEDLNIDVVSGKSINALRYFTGKGVLVWGARTLAGNSKDWRYISVRRTVTMIEQSIKLTLRSYEFSPNTQNTWVSIEGALSNFLTSLWNQGALQGAKVEDSFRVEIGLGSTMTDQDVLNGRLLLSVSLAISRPAEFMVLTMEQKLMGG